nr:chemotaxis protein CheW [Alkalilimnicola ehrlichii]
MGELTKAVGSADSDIEQYLTFVLGDEMFGAGIRQVREIIEYHNVTTVPMMPSFVRGVINLRGSVVPVIDLSARFGRGRRKSPAEPVSLSLKSSMKAACRNWV